MTTYSTGELAALYMQANPGVDSDTARTMAAIATAESSGRSSATNTNKNGSIDRGLWQINSVWLKNPDFVKRFGDLNDPITNARAAEYIRGKQGLTAWSTYNHGSFRKFMGAVVKNPVKAVKGAATGAAEGAASAAVDKATGGIKDALTPVTSFVTGLPRMILRFQALAGIALLAAILIILGVVLLLKESDAGKAVAGAAMKAAT